MANKNGWSAINVTGVFPSAARLETSTTVLAAASVPYSLT